ncbi:O-antigen ligase family protein [Photobacterium sp. J15]|uniref:O-antigen ligase family protein n=1 Tax=Photobacterium sp. J15 TaxID=265901 RepID=UPI0007E49725|nr:O-antigen ligase family protein [Photobacterium sp. J15]
MNYRHIAVISAAALFPALCIAFGKGYNYAAILLLLASLPCLITYETKWVTSDARLAIIAFSTYFLSFVVSTIITGGELSNLDQPSRAVLALPIFLALLRYPPKFSWLSTGILCGSIVTGLVGAYFAVTFPGKRAFDGALGPAWIDGYMQIQSGNMAATLAMLSLCISLYFLRKKQWLLLGLAIIATGMGITASILSGSRGGWLLIPLTFVYLLYVNRDLFTKKVLFAVLIGFTCFSAISWGNNSVSGRINKSIANIQAYQTNNKYTSVGIRLDLWKSAIYSFAESPIVGHGEEGRLEARKRHGKEGLINPRISRLPYHSHNQFLESMSVMGLIGLIPLLAFFYIPLKIFEKHRQRCESATTQTLCQCGTVSIVMMIGYCLTQAYFNHTSGIIFYSVMTLILLAACISPARSSS